MILSKRDVLFCFRWFLFVYFIMVYFFLIHNIGKAEPELDSYYCIRLGCEVSFRGCCVGGKADWSNAHIPDRYLQLT